VAIVRDVAATAALTGELLTRLHSAGNVTDLELAETRAFEQRSLLILAEAEQAAIDRRATLWRWLGGPERPAALKLPASLPGSDAELPALADLEKRALEQSLDLRRMRAEHDRLDKTQSLAKIVGVLPDLRAGVHVERDHDEWAIGPSAALSLPLFDHGQAAVEAAEATQRGLVYERTAHALWVRAAALSLRSRLELAHARVQRYVEQLLPLRRTIVEQSLLQYNAMQIGVAQLLVARSRELEEKRAYVGALRGYWLLRAELDQLLAGRLMDGMSGPGHAAGGSAAPSMPADDPGGH
jgi:outer membrane protein, heavy metal efflux system